jgi:hypothetical protein
MLAASPRNGLVCGDKRNPFHAASVRILDEMVEECDGNVSSRAYSPRPRLDYRCKQQEPQSCRFVCSDIPA